MGLNHNKRWDHRDEIHELSLQLIDKDRQIAKLYDQVQDLQFRVEQDRVELDYRNALIGELTEKLKEYEGEDCD